MPNYAARTELSTKRAVKSVKYTKLFLFYLKLY